jgi:hypothetical protein
MNFKKIAIGLLLLSAAPAFAGDIDGKWAGSLDTPNGAVAVNFAFTSEGGTLTGFQTGPDGSMIAIKDGKVAGSKVSFSLTVDFGMGPTTFLYTGEVSPTQLKLHTSFMDMAIDYSLKKA